MLGTMTPMCGCINVGYWVEARDVGNNKHLCVSVLM